MTMKVKTNDDEFTIDNYDKVFTLYKTLLLNNSLSNFVLVSISFLLKILPVFIPKNITSAGGASPRSLFKPIYVYRHPIRFSTLFLQKLLHFHRLHSILWKLQG